MYSHASDISVRSYQFIAGPQIDSSYWLKKGSSIILSLGSFVRSACNNTTWHNVIQNSYVLKSNNIDDLEKIFVRTLFFFFLGSSDIEKGSLSHFCWKIGVVGLYPKRLHVFRWSSCLATMYSKHTHWSKLPWNFVQKNVTLKLIDSQSLFFVLFLDLAKWKANVFFF